MGKKNIEQLFKDIFKDFQESPDEKVWASIESTLDKNKNKRRVIPIWWKLGGVAALFALLFFAINPFEGADDVKVNTDTQVVGTDNEKDEIIEQNTVTKTQENKTTTEETPSENANPHQSGGLVNSDKTQNLDEIIQPKKFGNPIATDIAVSNTKSTDNTTAIISSDSPQIDKNENEVVENVTIAQSQNSNKSVKKLEKDNIQNIVNQNSTKVAQTDITKEEKKEQENPEKKSIYDAIAEQNAEEDEELLVKNTESRWAVGPSVAPVYFTSAGDGSAIHSNFNTNSKTGNVNLSYGLTVSYNLGKRLRVRSGVHRVDYGYDTNDIVFSSSLQASTNELIDNIDYSETSRNLVVQSAKALPSEAASSAFTEVSAAESPALAGKIVQQLGYIEVPLELNYALVDKKLGVNVIGGVSSLFLVDNAVLLESENLVTEVGEANNANSVNFSTNVGIGLNYKIAPKMQFNLEPVFKYQLNTFSETAGPFRPFSVGVYSGMSFKF